MIPSAFSARRAIALLVMLLLVGACSDSTAPDDAASGNARSGAEGSFDPAAESFVLKTLDLPPPWDGPVVRVQLIGSNLVVNAANEFVSLDVSIRNISGRPLYAPAVAWVENFTPAGVSITNPDLTLAPPSFTSADSTFADWLRYGFDYSDYLGDDGVLEFEETSGTKTWTFHDPGLGSFSFQGWAEFGMAPERSRIAGKCFSDLNNNGIPDADDPPLQGAFITVVTATGDILRANTDAWGHYSLPVEATGLYSLSADILFGMPPFPPWTTPNPREVLLTPGANGLPNSFLEAHFGMAADYPAPPAPPIQFTDLPPSDLHAAPWNLISARLDGNLLRLHVGFSGCSPEHPFRLWMSGGFMESHPVQANIVLVNELDEECDAWFEQHLVFNLQRLGHKFVDAYGPGVLLMNLVQPDSSAQVIEWGIYPPD